MGCGGWRRRQAPGLRLAGVALVVAVAVGVVVDPRPAAAQTGCRFVFGFATLRTMVGAQTVGNCLENERFNPANGNAEQRTTGGLLVWRKADNWTAFTDGQRTWVNGPNGLQQRLNTQRFAWEGGGGAAAARRPADAIASLVAQLQEVHRERLRLLAELVAELDGNAHLVGGDGEYLGKVTSNASDRDAITNPVGRYGSDIPATSIHNQIGRYGSPVSRYSAYNTIASEPPRIVIGSTRVGYLTKNSIKLPDYDPDELLALLGRGVFASVLHTEGEVAFLSRLDGSRFGVRTPGCRLSAGDLVVVIDNTIRKPGDDRRCRIT